MKELDLVILIEALPEKDLEAGDVGTIVAVYGSGNGFEVEFVTYSGETLAVTTLRPNQIKPIGTRVMMSTRNF